MGLDRQSFSIVTTPVSSILSATISVPIVTGGITPALADGSTNTMGNNVFAYADIDKARTVFAWGPTPRPSDVAAKKQPPTKPGAAKKTRSKKSASPELPATADAVKVVNA